MKSILLFFLLCAGTSFSQDFSAEELVIPFEWHTASYTFNKWELTEGKYKSYLDGRWDFTASLPYSGTDDYVYRNAFYRTTDDRYIEFSHYPGARFFFQEWSDSLRSDRLHFGEVEINYNSLDLKEKFLTSIDGEDSLVLDSIYTFQKVGSWEFRLPDGSKLFGDYRYGQRRDTWTRYLVEPSGVGFLPVLATYEYEEDVLKSTDWLDQSKLTTNEKMKFLKGYWKMFPRDAKTVALCKQGSCIYKFEKTEKAKYPCSNYFMGSVACGTIAERNPLKWTVNEDGTITIENRKYTILYLTDNQLMLRLEQEK